MKISKDYNNLHEGVKNYLHFKNNLLKKLKTSFRSLTLELSAVSIRMKEISDTFNSLMTVSEKSNDNETVIGTYKILNNKMKKWAETIDYQINIVDCDYIDFFKYVRKEFNCFQEVIFIC